MRETLKWRTLGWTLVVIGFILLVIGVLSEDASLLPSVTGAAMVFAGFVIGDVTEQKQQIRWREEEAQMVREATLPPFYNRYQRQYPNPMPLASIEELLEARRQKKDAETVDRIARLTIGECQPTPIPEPEKEDAVGGQNPQAV